MRTFLLITLIVGGLALSPCSEVFGQLSIQQPVIQSTGGHFTVSVPDRGGVLLGSVSRAGESRKSYGFPFTRGSSVGRFAQHSSMSSHVWIHDLREMDRQVLEMAESDFRSQHALNSVVAKRSGLAWSEFQPRRGVAFEDRRPSVLSAANRYRSGLSVAGRSSDFSSSMRGSVERKTVSGSNRFTAPSARRSKALDPDHSYRLGVEAEESGKLRLAKLHYEVAAQYGSEQAALRLRGLTSQPIAGK